MRIIEYSKDFAHQSLDKWRNNKESISLNEDYSIIRTNLIEFYMSSKDELTSDDRKEYLLDVIFGLKLYSYFQSQVWFNLRIAANDSFWRYIAVAVIPDIVSDRWGKNKDNYFWKQSNRLWPKTLWWYIHLTWNESLDQTKKMLMLKHFNSDTIQGIVERTGRKGTFVDVYREIIHQYSCLDNNTIIKFKKKQAQGSDSLFRAIMKLNTARSLVTDPCLYEGGMKGYVESMIRDLIEKL